MSRRAGARPAPAAVVLVAEFAEFIASRGIRPLDGTASARYGSSVFSGDRAARTTSHNNQQGEGDHICHD